MLLLTLLLHIIIALILHWLKYHALHIWNTYSSLMDNTDCNIIVLLYQFIHMT